MKTELEDPEPNRFNFIISFCSSGILLLFMTEDGEDISSIVDRSSSRNISRFSSTDWRPSYPELQVSKIFTVSEDRLLLVLLIFLRHSFFRENSRNLLVYLVSQFGICIVFFNCHRLIKWSCCRLFPFLVPFFLDTSHGLNFIFLSPPAASVEGGGD